ncbi:P-loop containing nucleoside triphosphate hydrolase protein [Ephemerocybe angulata]|uniref:P-loop containing nucleoside triphosphate hydrolase protein n=1 Tax=Ephemerocybe angulata TaxID=980116 RepID=A0A8H6HV62_9AGAR|nr:P-loop containing nucleoside triphosphate hydrolase protein [Tulosesus angulatus]
MSLCGTSKGASLGRGKPVVVCGDGACGKTSLLNVFTRGFFTQVYEPTVVDDQLVELSLWDTAGQEEFDRLRSLSYAETHVVMVCFSVDNPVSLENIESKWLDEILEYCPGVKLVLVGHVTHALAALRACLLVILALKCDLRDDRVVKERLSRFGGHTVQYEEGLAVARRIRASRYLECSSKHNRGVSEVFYEAARVSLSTRTRGTDEGCIVC